MASRHRKISIARSISGKSKSKGNQKNKNTSPPENGVVVTAENILSLMGKSTTLFYAANKDKIDLKKVTTSNMGVHKGKVTKTQLTAAM